MLSLRIAIGILLFALMGASLSASAATISDDSFQLALTQFDALADPPIVVNLTSLGVGTDHTFSNSAQSNLVSIDASSSSVVDLLSNTIFADLTTLSWQAGDAIVYSNGGGTSIGGLLSGSTYYLADSVAVPEPSTAALIGVGLVGMGLRRRRG